MPNLQTGSEKKKKEKYRITNWSEYNISLKKRGSISIWISASLIESKWYYDGPVQRGAQYIYSDECIECLLELKVVFGLAFRQLEGFCLSLLLLMGYDHIDVPSYSQIHRRAQQLDIDPEVPDTDEPVHLVFDSSGLKVYGEGEWKVRKHGFTKRRTWRKLHIGVDEGTGFIYAHTLTENDQDDGSQLVPMLTQVEAEIEKVGGDGGYDKTKCWNELIGREIEIIVPPQRNAVYWTDEEGNILDHPRNVILKKIEEMGRKEWKQQSGYHRRSLSETAFFRIKTIFGSNLYSRQFKRQQTEAAIKIKVLNKMTTLGMPISVKVA